ncbi:MAG: hypothetical protein ACTING_08630 [Leuconostoc mesenteroides]
MTFDEAIEELRLAIPEKFYSPTMHDISVMLEAQTKVINLLREEYAPTIEMTQEQYQQFIDFRKRTDSVQTHAVTLHDKKTKYPEFLNDLVGGVYGRLFLQAWLHPETIEIVDE